MPSVNVSLRGFTMGAAELAASDTLGRPALADTEPLRIGWLERP